VIPFGVWIAVTDPCPGCGKKLAGGFRQKIDGARAADSTWVFWVVREFRCRLCEEHMTISEG
jgi:hypothetical protein